MCYRNRSCKHPWGTQLAGGKSGGWAFTRRVGALTHSSKHPPPPPAPACIPVSGAISLNQITPEISF